MSAVEYKERFAKTDLDHLLIDVRRPDEYASEHLLGSVNIPLEEIDKRLVEISRAKPVVVYCRSGNRSGKAAKYLMDEGFDDVLNAGGLAELAQLGVTIES